MEKCNLFADDTFLFSAVHDIDNSVNDINHDLEKISEWVFQWKIKFKPDPTKLVQEITFSRKKKCFYSPTCLF